ncbi:Mre11 DNA-binding presumed domain-containing protein, partial [Lipomyces japonicus]|uniref:Mre11 DNA-binding presumed domain-containing protein n=1 Tax=Lipomyces japonicus TaxID=56871 RepID=UPI0034CEE67D
PNTIRILVSSDNHVGYNERDPIRGDDSGRTFDEVMNIAKNNDVDMVLLGGDLFHENKPSRKSMYQVVKTLRNTCYGEKPCELQILSDVQTFMNDDFCHVNYEDPDINVAIPVFSISGNHDDASGEGNLAPLDVLAASGLVNHFGKVPENDNITLAPILFQKGFTRLALYGMSNVRDERLFRTFRDQHVKFLRPSENENANGADEWFNMMAVHQNHHSHTETSYLPENFLPKFLNMVLWGHEHECLIDPELNAETGFFVMQPGSSVATSLCEGEAKEKYVGILSITGTDFKLEKIKLKTVRPFVMKEVVLARDCGFAAGSKNKSLVIEWLINQVEDLISETEEQWRDSNPDSDENEFPPLPLVRLRVEYSGGYEVENPRRFSNRFVGRVANVNDVVQFYRKKTTAMTRKVNSVGQVIDVVDAVDLDSIKVQSLVQDFLKNLTLEVLSEGGLNQAISQFVDKDDKYAVKSFVDEALTSKVKSLLSLGEVDENNIDHAVRFFAGVEEDVEAKVPTKRRAQAATAKKPGRGRKTRKIDDSVSEASDVASDDFDMETTQPAPSRALRSANASKQLPKATTKIPKTDSLFIDDDDNDNEDEDEEIEEVVEESDEFEPEPEPVRHPKKSRATKPSANSNKNSTLWRAAKRVPPVAPFSSSISPAKAQSMLNFDASQSQRGNFKRNMAPIVSDVHNIYSFFD